MPETIHNPDQYMNDLRQLLAQGRKRIGFLLGAGGPASLTVDKLGEAAANGAPLIPTVKLLTESVVAKLRADHADAIDGLLSDLGDGANIEDLLSRARGLEQAIGLNKIHDLDGPGYGQLAKRMCDEIGQIVNKTLPNQPNAYSELVGWIGGAARSHAFEVFTTNYDLLLEEALERSRIPYFDGFCGGYEPFFDAASISGADISPRWVRVWKLHGSLGWDINSLGQIVRKGQRNATQLIYPTHLKYEQTQKLPYSALMERLRSFLSGPDSLLLVVGFSFADAHIAAVIDESLSRSPGSAALAFQFGNLDSETHTCEIANRRSNLSAYCRDGAVINCIRARWAPGKPPSKEWGPIRASYWGRFTDADSHDSFLLGNFPSLVKYVALSRAEQIERPVPQSGEVENV